MSELGPGVEDTLPQIVENHVLSRAEILDVAEKVLQFCLESTGVRLYDYQTDFARRIVQSVLLEDADEVTALFSRQSGKTEVVSVVIVGMAVLLPQLAQIPALGADSRIGKYKEGFWVGIFAPVFHQAGIMYNRMVLRASSERFKEVLRDPDINMPQENEKKPLKFSNGSRIDVHSAAPQSNIEGETYHLMVLEECQDIGNYKIRASIHPMGAATGASLVKIGTPAPHRNDFYDACKRNEESDRRNKHNKDYLKRHYQYDYTHAARANPRYAKFIAKESERLGYDSDEFRLKYRLHWLIERGMFVEPEVLHECSIRKRDRLTAQIQGRRSAFIRPDYPATQDPSSVGNVASIDIGRTNDSTVITVARVWWDNPIEHHGHKRYYVHVMNWLELYGDDHETQYPQILRFLQNYRVTRVIVDATGRGDPVADRLTHDLGARARKDGGPAEVLPFVFSLQSKDRLYRTFYEELRARRFSVPAGIAAQKQTKWKRFEEQMLNLEKHWKGRYMSVQAPTGRGKGKSDAINHDDYADSAAMLCWLVNGEADRTVEMTDLDIMPSHRNALVDRRRNALLQRASRHRTGSALHRRR